MEGEVYLTPRVVVHELMYRKTFLWEYASHPEWVVFIVKSGTFTLNMNEKKVTVNGGDVVFFPPGMSFFRKIIAPAAFHYIQFVPSAAPDALPIPVGKVSFADSKRLLSTIHALDLTADAIEKNKVQWCQHFLDDIIYQYYFESRDTSIKGVKDPEEPILREVIEYFQHNLQQKINLSVLSKKMGVTHVGLIGKFKREMGITPVEYLLSLRIGKAKHLLVNTDLSMSRIGEICGFGNCYYFSNVFKKQTGYSPSQYRLSFHV